MSLEQSFRDYISVLNGNKKDFSEIEPFFDAIYDDDFQHQMDGNPVTKEHLRRILTNHLAIGTKATLLKFEYISPDSIMFKFQLVNEKADLIIHNIATIKDDKIYRVQSVNDSLESIMKARSISDFYTVESKLHAYLNKYDGNVKSFDEMEAPFEDLFHEAFVHTADGRPIDKIRMRATVKTLLSAGTKVDLLMLNQLDDAHFEVKIHIVNKFTDVIGHSMGTIDVQERKLIKLEPYDDAIAAYKKLRKIADMASLRENVQLYVNTQNNLESSLEDMESVFNKCFADNLVATIKGYQIGKSDFWSKIKENFTNKVTVTLVRCDVINENYIEVEMRGESDSCEEVWHDVSRVENGKIVELRNCDGNLASKVISEMANEDIVSLPLVPQ